MVTHDLDSLHTVCDRIAVLADGKIIAAGNMDAMLASEHPWLKAYFRGKRSRAGACGRTRRWPRRNCKRRRSMETRANYTLIGLFTLVVIAGVFGFVFWFQGGGAAAIAAITGSPSTARSPACAPAAR